LENAARFPLFHRSGDDGVSILNVESGHFTCYKKRTSSRANNITNSPSRAAALLTFIKTILPALRLGAQFPSITAFSATGPGAVKLRLCAKRPKPQFSKERVYRAYAGSPAS
jgi:hypothetical protein